MNSKDPPDKYRSLKLRLDVLKPNVTHQVNEIIQDAIIRTNKITIKTYLLARYWLLKKYHTSNQSLPILTEENLRMISKAVIKPSRGPKPKEDNLILFTELRELKNEFWKDDEDGTNLSYILNSYFCTTMLTNIENNIKCHFINHLRQFVNQSLKILFNNEYLANKKKVKAEWDIVKRDILNRTLKSDSKYHSWINTHRPYILPSDVCDDIPYEYDVKVNPQNYIRSMIYMNLELEKIKGKMFQFFPLQTSVIPKHITIDTSTLRGFFKDDNTEKLTYEYRENLWGKYFTIPKKSIPKNYSFNHLIQTDGYTVTLQLLNNKYKDLVESQKEKMATAREKARNETPEQKEAKKLAKENKTKIVKPKASKLEEPVEFPYFEDVDKELLGDNHIFIDPGRNTLLQMMNDEGKFLSYTNSMRISETKRLIYQKYLQRFKDKSKIIPIETAFAIYNSKTCILEKFKEYIIEKMKVNELLRKHYQEIKYRQYQWYGYINRRRSEDNLLNKIENFYKDKTKKYPVIIMGDWSMGKEKTKFISTPNVTLKRKLATRFYVYHIDEHLTSRLHHKTEERCSNLYLPDKKGQLRKMHSILTCEMEKTKRLGCINRDKNSCLNMRKIFQYHMVHKTRPERYRRDLQKYTRNPTVVPDSVQSSGVTPEIGCNHPNEGLMVEKFIE